MTSAYLSFPMANVEEVRRKIDWTINIPHIGILKDYYKEIKPHLELVDIHPEIKTRSLNYSDFDEQELSQLIVRLMRNAEDFPRKKIDLNLSYEEAIIVNHLLILQMGRLTKGLILDATQCYAFEGYNPHRPYSYSDLLNFGEDMKVLNRKIAGGLVRLPNAGFERRPVPAL